MTENLLASSTSWILDLVFVLLVVFGLAFGIRKGFISGVCKLAGTLFAIAIAVFFCVSFENFVESAFGMRTAIADGLLAQFSKKELMNVDVSGSDLGAAMSEAGVWGFIASAVVKSVAGAEIPSGTTIAMLISPLIAKWISVVISFVLLVVIVKLGAFILDKTLSGVADKLKPIRIVNQLLGGILGLCKILLVLLLVLAICSWLPVDSLDQWILSSNVVGKIYGSAWFANATSYVLSFDWLHSYIIQ